MGNLKTFEELKCWQACRDLRKFVSKSILPSLPKDERFRLTDQLIRATRSSTANIAEGYGRFHYLDNAKFCSNARGSVWETLDHLLTAHEDQFIDDQTLELGRDMVNTAVKILNGYIAYLRKSAQTPAAPPTQDPDNQ